MTEKNLLAYASRPPLDGDGFREIPRLVHIRSAHDCGVIREQLQRHDVHDR
jgi:hypothetical protein